MGQAMQMDKSLPSFLQLSGNNPLFSSNAAQNASQQYFNDAIQPQLNEDAVNELMGGNSNSTFGGSYLGSAAAQGADQAFFSGQQYYDNELSNMLNERGSLFGNEVNTAANQDNLASQMQLNTNSLNANELNAENNFNLQGANVLQGMGSDLLNQQTQFDDAKMAAEGQMVGGLFGLGGGVGNALFGQTLGNLGKGISNGVSNLFGGGGTGNSGFSGFSSVGMPSSFMGSSLGGFTY
jgi:hypothetical protein